MGLIDRNGCGESTLLKTIAGVYYPTNGFVKTRGSIALLIELGAGFDPELTARENVFLNGVIMGNTHEFMKEHFDEIIDFAELQQFEDVRNLCKKAVWIDHGHIVEQGAADEVTGHYMTFMGGK